MKIPIIGILLLSSIAFLSYSQVAAADPENAVSEDAAAIKVFNLCILPSGKTVLKCQNSGSKPVKAFKGSWVVFDDFEEASQPEEILFTSTTPVMGSSALLGGYLIQPNDTIYLAYDGKQSVAMVGRLASDAFGNLGDVPPAWKKRFKAVITNVVFAEREDIDNLHKQEEGAREQIRLRQQETARQADATARDAARKGQLDQMLKQSQTPTRELARIPMEDKRSLFIITDVSVELNGARTNFARAPRFKAGGSKAIVEDGAYFYFATQSDRDKALRIFDEAVTAWHKTFPEAANE